MSLPVRGAWIEITLILLVVIFELSLPVRGAWIEIQIVDSSIKIFESLPVRGAWIEISPSFGKKTACPVAPRAGSVD